MSEVINLFNDYLSKLYEKKNINSQLKQAINYSLLSNGKRLRPLLFFRILTSFGQDRLDRFFDVAAAIEMIHTYSLIHDDLPSMDNDNLRRGEKTNHVVFGEDMSILAGDALLTDAFSLIAKSSFSSDQKVFLIEALSHAAGSNNMVSGQVEDIKFDRFTKKELIKMHYHKTAAMFVASSEFAAIVLNLSEENRNYLQIFASDFGLAFQLKDDLADLKKESNDSNNFAASFGVKVTNELKDNYVNEAHSAIKQIKGLKFNREPLFDFLEIIN